MSPTQQAAQQLAQVIARFRLAERAAEQAVARISYTYAVVRTHHRIQP
jgi:phage shock protein A